MRRLRPPVDSVLDMIGRTPMVRVRGLDTGVCELYLKLESQNPGGSIKDRIGLSMVTAAEDAGLLRPGGTLIEATAGNTGLGLALIAAQKGYRLILVIPDKMSKDKIMHLKALGAEVHLTRSDVGKGHAEYYQDYAERLARETPNSLYINQFCNPNNVRAHYEGTAPEIWQQMDGRIDAFVAGVGSGGTLTGCASFLRERNADIDIVLADPVGSVLAEAVNTGTPATEVGSWVVEGIGEDFIPDILDLSLVNKAYSISDQEALMTVRTLLLRDGILAGTSSGTLIGAALQYCREQTEPKRVVTLVCDTGNKYLSKAYNDYWMEDQGFLERPATGDLRDYIARPATDQSVISTSETDTLMAAYGKMKLYDISQLPVLADGKLVGIVDETDVLLAVRGNEAAGFQKTVGEVMSNNLKTLAPTDSLDDLLPVFEAGMVPIIADDTQFYGLITRIDVINRLRRGMRNH